MNDFKFFQKNPIYKSGDVVAVICVNHDQFVNFINETRRRKNYIERIRRGRIERFDKIDGVKYICANRPEKIRGYRVNHIITLENAHENPFFDEINNFIIPCLVSETI